MENTYLQFLRSRRSIRRYKPEPVSVAALWRILEAATYAPSAHNGQHWRFALLVDARRKRQFAEEMAAQFLQNLLADGVSRTEATERANRSVQRITSAAAAVVLCLDLETVQVLPGEAQQAGELTMAMQSVALAGGTLLLAAHAEGLGGLWMCAPLFVQEVVRRELDLPQSWQPQALLLLGYAESVPEPPARKPVFEITRVI